MLTVHFIIVNYNSGEWLSRAVKSVLDHCAEIKFSVTVVDNASSDDSMRVAKERCDSNLIDWVFNTKNIGFAAANNQVLRNCEADFAVLMNPDCELLEEGISPILKALVDNERFGMASCRILNEDQTLQPTCRRFFPTPWTALVRMLRLNKMFPDNPKFTDFDYGSVVSADEENHTVEAVSGAFMVVRKRAIAEVGLLDEGYFMHCEDLDWCKRFQNAGWHVGFVPAAAVVHSKGVSSKSRPVKVLWTLHKGMDRFFDKFYRDSYAWPIRLSVKIGISLSFVARALAALLSSLFQRI